MDERRRADDGARRRIAANAELFIDAQMEAAYPRHYRASVEVRLVDGRTLKSSIFDSHAMPADPCSESERLGKFAKLASRVLAGATVERAVHTVRTLDRIRSSRALTGNWSA